MICLKCSKDCNDFDFINMNKTCFRCVYKDKILIENNREHCCKLCNKKFSINKELKTKQRSLYCSKQCAAIGYRKQRSNYWTKLLKSGPI